MRKTIAVEHFVQRFRGVTCRQLLHPSHQLTIVEPGPLGPFAGKFMKIAANQKFVMIGDSITDAGRAKPIAEGLFDPLGRGYVNFVDALLQAVYPERNFRVVNVGSTGHTVKDLATRWQTDVLDLKPNWLSVMIGTNDVWRQFDCPKIGEWHVLPAEYERVYDELLSKTRQLLAGLILATPFYIEPNRADAMRARMDEYGAIVARLADRYDAIFVDTQAAFDCALTHCHSSALAWDRVHPNQTGHMILAKAVLNALDFDWSNPSTTQ